MTVCKPVNNNFTALAKPVYNNFTALAIYHTVIFVNETSNELEC